MDRRSEGQLPAGLTLSSNPNGTATISGTPVLVGTPTFTVQVEDSEVNPANGNPAPAMAPATFSIGISAGTTNNTLLSGPYAFLFNGFDSDGPVQLVGTLTSNGAGLITSGTVDSNRVSGVALGGSHCGRGRHDASGELVFHRLRRTRHNGIDDGVRTERGNVADYRLALDADGNIKFFQDYTTTATKDPKHTHGEGILKPVAGITFSSGSLSGNYAFALPGYEAATNKPVALAGRIHSDGLTLSSGMSDFTTTETTRPSRFRALSRSRRVTKEPCNWFSRPTRRS